MCTGIENFVEPEETVEQLLAQCEEFFVDPEPEPSVEELVEPNESVEQLLAQANEFIL